MNKWCEKEIEEVIVAISKASSPEKVRDLFNIILTPREINDIARRYKILEMLNNGRSYADISMALGVSSSIISRVSNGIGYGYRRSEPTSTMKPINKDNYKHRKRIIRYKGFVVNP